MCVGVVRPGLTCTAVPTAAECSQLRAARASAGRGGRVGGGDGKAPPRSASPSGPALQAAQPHFPRVHGRPHPGGAEGEGEGPHLQGTTPFRGPRAWVPRPDVTGTEGPMPHPPQAPSGQALLHRPRRRGHPDPPGRPLAEPRCKLSDPNPECTTPHVIFFSLKAPLILQPLRTESWQHGNTVYQSVFPP